ncbi:MAG: hypothetical protein R3B40_04400 [Polyangiales bacterium]|nr:hypothetical protein [Myxococcales bacterium]MCB9660199.1 hypothetical protein [Sandaracinaceae bacterium]
MRMNALGWAGLIVAFVAAAVQGCASTHEVAPPAGIALDDCYVGAFFADCGGEGTPRFACPETSGSCRWFTGGTVAEGYVAWSCADGQICCDDGAGPAFPEPFMLSAPTFFHENGAAPWTRERALVLAVDVDPGLTGDLSVRCTRDGQEVHDDFLCGEADGQTVRRDYRYSASAQAQDTLSVGVLQTSEYAGQRLYVEIMPDVSLARACLFPLSDWMPLSCVATRYAAVTCAEEGHVTLSAWPGPNGAAVHDMVVAGEVTFADGLTMTFTMPP